MLQKNSTHRGAMLTMNNNQMRYCVYDNHLCVENLQECKMCDDLNVLPEAGILLLVEATAALTVLILDQFAVWLYIHDNVKLNQLRCGRCTRTC